MKVKRVVEVDVDQDEVFAYINQTDRVSLMAIITRCVKRLTLDDLNDVRKYMGEHLNEEDATFLTWLEQMVGK